MRNNYPPFNPIEWANIHDAVDPIKSIGIRMVSKLAKEINYSAVINLNVFLEDAENESVIQFLEYEINNINIKK